MRNKEKKKITFVIGSMGKGGAERVISLLANEYAKRDWKVDILLLLEDKSDYTLDENVNLISFANHKISRILYFPVWHYRIRKYLKKTKPDQVISFIARINIITILANLGVKRPLIISERNDPKQDGRSLITSILTKLLYPLADKVVFQTAWAQSCFPKKITKKSVIIANPIKVEEYATGILSKKIVSVGRLIEQKNHKLLIKAFKKVSEKYPDYELMIYGEGRLRGELSNLINELNLSKKVLLPGNSSNIHQEISNAEIFVLSSDYEGLSNALLEAMMMGIPCISTDCAGSIEFIDHEKSGYIVRRGDEKALYEAMIKLIEDKELAKNISLNASLMSNKLKVENIISLWDREIMSLKV